MRLYSFVNSYLSDLQKGIQTAHLVNEFCNKYADFSKEAELFQSWSNVVKTIIVFSGGNQFKLEAYEIIFQHSGNHYPWCSFREDDESLNGALTAIGIVLPDKFDNEKDRLEYIYCQKDAAAWAAPAAAWADAMDIQLAQILNESHLA